MEHFKVEELKFISCLCTNTRLMGVVGVHSLWTDLQGNQLQVLFHLDFEDYGIDGYQFLMNPPEEDVRYEVQRMMGGLGGTMVSIDEAEFTTILSEAYQLNLERDEALPYGALPWVELTTTELRLCMELYAKISVPVESLAQSIHYAIMRFVGMDRFGFEFLTRGHVDFIPPVRVPSMLLKNIIHDVDEEDGLSCQITSLVSTEGKYKVLHWTARLEDAWVITELVLGDQLVITGQEAALWLRRDEYIQVFAVEDVDRLETYFDAYKPECMCNHHDEGVLYTAFRNHNHHVKDQTYYLNGDIFAVYYLKSSGELVISSFDEQCFEEAVGEFEEGFISKTLTSGEMYLLNQSIIYEYVHSDVKTFKDFVENL